MKIKNIRDLNVDELIQKRKEFTEELFKLKLRQTTGQLDSSAMLGSLRKDIARINTVLREREAA
ncbi:MAG: 50S ribosomal protein L29 [Syntrophales bacterium]|jgi:large subunit ribosomal protein L29